MIAAWDFLSLFANILLTLLLPLPDAVCASPCPPRSHSLFSRTLSAGTSVQRTFAPIHFPLVLSRNICPWQSPHRVLDLFHSPTVSSSRILHPLSKVFFAFQMMSLGEVWFLKVFHKLLDIHYGSKSSGDQSLALQRNGSLDPDPSLSHPSASVDRKWDIEV